MDSICTKAMIMSIFAAAICFSAPLSRADEIVLGNGDPVPLLDVGTQSQELMLLAQNGAAQARTQDAKRDTVYLQAPAATTASRHTRPAMSSEELIQHRDHFQSMQNTGFGLLMGGIGAGVGGILLMANGLSQMQTTTDAYGDESTSDKGSGKSW